MRVRIPPPEWLGLLVRRWCGSSRTRAPRFGHGVGKIGIAEAIDQIMVGRNSLDAPCCEGLAFGAHRLGRPSHFSFLRLKWPAPPGAGGTRFTLAPNEA